MSGLMSVTGTPESAPLRVGPPIVDYVAGLYAAFAVMAGLAARGRAGAFRRIDVAMRDCALAMMGSRLLGALDAGDIHHHGARKRRPARGRAVGRRAPRPSTTKLYDRRGYNPEKAASFFATY